MKRSHVFFSFLIPGWNFIPVFLIEMSSSGDEISSRQKLVNSKRHFTIDKGWSQWLPNFRKHDKKLMCCSWIFLRKIVLLLLKFTEPCKHSPTLILLDAWVYNKTNIAIFCLMSKLFTISKITFNTSEVTIITENLIGKNFAHWRINNVLTKSRHHFDMILR